jgi:hypothetical protein
MSKLARALALAAMLAATNLAAMTAVAHAHTSSDPASTRHRTLGRVESPATGEHAVTAQQQTTGDAAVRRLLARERFSVPDTAPSQPTSPVQPATPSGQAGWLTPALGGLAAVLAVVAGVAVLVARRAHRSQRASQVA